MFDGCDGQIKRVPAKESSMYKISKSKNRLDELENER